LDELQPLNQPFFLIGENSPQSEILNEILYKK
jgi:hypothetical protein